MKKKQNFDIKKGLILLGIAIVIIVIILVAVNVNHSGETGAPSDQAQSSQQGQAGQNAITENKYGEYSKSIENGIIVNTSEKLSSTKTFESYELSNISMKKSGNTTQISGTIKNTSNSATPFQMLKFTLVDKNGKEIQTISCAVKELEAGESTSLNTSASYDFVDAYDFKISK